MKSRRLTYLLCAAVISTSACSGSQSGSAIQSQPNPPPSQGSSSSGIPDVSVQRCREKGYKVEAIRNNGIPQGYICINTHTGAKCDSWAYYRGECRLTDKSNQKPLRKSDM